MAQCKWNNGNHTVNETNAYPLNNDPSTLSTLDFELDTYGTLTLEAYLDDQGWPTPHRTSIRRAVKPPHSIRGSCNARIVHGRADENGQRQLRLPDRC